MFVRRTGSVWGMVFVFYSRPLCVCPFWVHGKGRQRFCFYPSWPGGEQWSTVLAEGRTTVKSVRVGFTSNDKVAQLNLSSPKVLYVKTLSVLALSCISADGHDHSLPHQDTRLIVAALPRYAEMDRLAYKVLGLALNHLFYSRLRTSASSCSHTTHGSNIIHTGIAGIALGGEGGGLFLQKNSKLWKNCWS